jgi:hypothetical protein
MSPLLVMLTLGAALAETEPTTSEEAAAEAPPPEGLEEVTQEARDAFQEEGGQPAPTLMGPPVRVKALRDYRNRHLDVRSYSYQTGGGSSGTWVTVPFHGRGHHGFFSTMFWSDPVRTHQTWGIYQGPELITTPRFFELSGADKRLEVLTSDIHRARSATRVWNGVAITGVVGVVAGIIGMSLADTAREAQPWGTVTTLGSLTAITGLFGASFPSGKAQRLVHRPSTIMTSAEAQGLADRHNDRLARELELSADEAWQVEEGLAPRGGQGRSGKRKGRR